MSKNIKELLLASGSGFDKVVKTTCFLKNMEDFATFHNMTKGDAK